MVVVERNGLGVIEHVLAVVVLLGGDGVIDDLEVATLAFDFVGDGFDVVPDAPHREMILVSSPFVAPERVVGWVVPGTAVAAASRKVLGLQLYGFPRSEPAGAVDRESRCADSRDQHEAGSDGEPERRASPDRRACSDGCPHGFSAAAPAPARFAQGRLSQLVRDVRSSHHGAVLIHGWAWAGVAGIGHGSAPFGIGGRGSLQGSTRVGRGRLPACSATARGRGGGGFARYWVGIP